MDTERTPRTTKKPAKPATGTRPRRRTKTPPPAEPTIQQMQSATADEIARRAYEISLERNGRPGDALSDWLQAEQELKASRA